MILLNASASARRAASIGGLGLLALGTSALAAPRQADDVQAPSTGPIRDALQSVSEDVQIYNDHLTILASPWMEGRLPGTRGMELAKEYMEYYFRQYGLKAPYDGEVVQPDGTSLVEAEASFRQPFDLGESADLVRGELEFEGGGQSLGFERGKSADFTVTGLGEGGKAKGDMVFVGYGIDNEDQNYSSYAEGETLEGKIAVMLRFEPFREDGSDAGKSLWKRAGRSGWTSYAGFAHKLEQAAKLGAAGVVIINTPGVADRRAGALYGMNNVSLANPFEGPVLHMSTDAGRRLIERASGGATTLEELTSKANAGEPAAGISGTLDLDVLIDRRPLSAENIVAVLPGKGSLAEEKIVIGAHLDHLGMGDFGSRDRAAGMKLHPGADDNATGCAGILHIAKRMARDYAEAPADADLRTIVFIAFSAEESGLIGAAHYAENPLGSLGSHKLMMNFDMIGRMTNSRVKLSGTWTADGLGEFLQPIVERSPLTVVQERRAGGGSDHQMFYRRRVPVLFSIIADFHGDYHTSRDVSPLINRVEAVHAANLFYDIATEYAKLPETFPYMSGRDIQRKIKAADEAAESEADEEPARAGPVRARVRLGIRPEYNADEEGRPPGILIGSVSEGSPAEAAGLKGGDRIVKWGGKDIEGARQLGEVLSSAEPGDKVALGVVRDGETIEIEVTLVGR
ncbi:MAG: M28 family peptidase [Planctomycetota bacterium]|nr:M28 family peptidase [Planctomycetota bacterium]